ncbi:hypothetical protein VSR01_17105 [Actinacidiphila sp. DG2A-62]|uniref:hypothetical protein n=1 Tax=Actinacidiphila sp. DG2A-62 TaxID=3108821 RepID=UPI002DBDD9AC|nr:hypothetical protein [Actinacidiphila sp. DG2A-62]MEC3995157.1 hypothetical protein [Actinacidiphila sp. DG2A-62]
MAGTGGSVAGRQDAEPEILCDDNGAFLRRFTVDDTGALVPEDATLDGADYTAVGTVRRCEQRAAPAAPLIDSTLQRQSGAGTVTIPAGARSVTLVVYAGSPTVAIGGGAAVAVAAGTSLSWGVDTGGKAGESLQDAFVFTGVAGADFLVSSTREI